MKTFKYYLLPEYGFDGKTYGSEKYDLMSVPMWKVFNVSSTGIPEEKSMELKWVSQQLEKKNVIFTNLHKTRDGKYVVDCTEDFLTVFPKADHFKLIFSSKNGITEAGYCGQSVRIDFRNFTIDGKTKFQGVKCKRTIPKLLCYYEFWTGPVLEIQAGYSQENGLPVVYLLGVSNGCASIVCYNLVTDYRAHLDVGTRVKIAGY